MAPRKGRNCRSRGFPSLERGPRQLPLDLPVTARYGPEDFLVSDCNERAYRFLETWPNWPDPVCVLTGPPGSGKTHLAAIFAKASGGIMLEAAEIGVAQVPALAGWPSVVIENADREPRSEPALFHLLNLARQGETSVLVTGTGPLAAWNIVTPDLVSRLRLATTLSIDPPDDNLLRALLVKMFVDRQLVVDTHVLDFLARRIERSFAACRLTVEALDREALALGRRITRPVAAEVLRRIGFAGEDEPE